MATIAEGLPPEQFALPPNVSELGVSLFTCYVASEYGQWQAKQPLRYESAFGCYGRDEMLADLGPDVHPVEHMPVTARSLSELVTFRDTNSNWSSKDIRAAIAAAMLHDIGECTHPELEAICGVVVNDIPQGRKTDKDRLDEARVRGALRELLFADVGPMINRLEELITHREDSPIHTALEAAHDANTFRVGLRAGKIVLDAETRPPEDKRLAQLSTMAVLVTGDVIDRMEHHAGTFGYVDDVLTRSATLYNRIHVELAA